FTSRGDVHRQTASKLFVCPPELVTSEQRQAGKRVNFGLVYGMGDKKLARDVGIGEEKAREFINAFNDLFATMRSKMNAMKAEAFLTGFATSLHGRRRSFRGAWQHWRLRELEQTAVEALEMRRRHNRLMVMQQQQ
ncbi:hypothetical protein Agub_g9504, partial [Astrephomene gubernaculifera]